MTQRQTYSFFIHGLVLALVFVLFPTSVGAQTAVATLSATLLEMPGWQGYHDGSVPLRGARYNNGNFIIASDCSPTNDQRGQFYFTQSGQLVSEQDICEDGGVPVDVHSPAIGHHIQFTQDGGIVRGVRPTTRIAPPVYYRISGGSPQFISRAYNHPNPQSGAGAPGVFAIYHIAVANDHVVAVREATVAGPTTKNIVYSLPSWDEEDDLGSWQFTPITGIGNLVIANSGNIAISNRGVEVWEVTNSGSLRFVEDLLPNDRIAAYAIDSVNPNRVALRSKLSNTVYIYEYDGDDGLTLVETRTFNTSPDNFNTSGENQGFAISGDTMILPVSTSAGTGFQVWRGTQRQGTVVLPPARVRDSLGGGTTANSAVSGIAMSPGGNILVTTFDGAYLYTLSGGGGGGSQRPGTSPSDTPSSLSEIDQGTISSFLKALQQIRDVLSRNDNVQTVPAPSQVTSFGNPFVGSSGNSCPALTQPLTIGSTGERVSDLQMYLMGEGFSIPAISAGASYGFFGTQTQSAVAAWQTANGVAPTAGYFGPISLARYNQVCGL